MLRTFIALKNQSSSATFEPTILGSSNKHANYYTTEGNNRKNTRITHLENLICNDTYRKYIRKWLWRYWNGGWRLVSVTIKHWHLHSIYRLKKNKQWSANIAELQGKLTILFRVGRSVRISLLFGPSERAAEPFGLQYNANWKHFLLKWRLESEDDHSETPSCACIYTILHMPV
jgi:hypothetical protein